MTTQQLINQKALEIHNWNWNGYTIPYTVMGKGQPLLLIHGFGACIRHWQKNIPVLAENGYRVFSIDLLGFGDSDKPPIDYTLELWREQIKDFWHAHIQEPTVFIGNSIGGLLTLMVMAEYPEITAGGVIINGAGGLNHRPNELKFPLRLIMRTFTKLISSPLTGPLIFNRIRQKHRIRNTLYQVYCDRTAVTEELVELLYQPSCHRGAQKVFASIVTAPPGPTVSDLLPKVKHPLLVLWGENDPWTPIQGANIYQEREKSGQDTTFYPILQAGHCPHDEKPEIVNQLLIQWLSLLNK